ncbi:MAG: shikimate dehydrogenase [Rhodospirillales bacterium]|nr:shikimate dehydrogenase [Rhodospirillales bacterium]
MTAAGPGSGPSGRARVAGVIGWPTGHSLSPRLHGFWLRAHGVDGAYVPLPVRPEDFETAIRTLAKLGFSGANITVPHKERALRICDDVEDQARRIGAVNTLVVRDGKILGRNTDAYGFVANLKAARPALNLRAAPAAVIGAGGAARAVAAALIDEGVPELRIANRTAERAEVLARALGPKLTVVPWDQRAAMLDGAGLLVNTTTQGMTPNPPLDLALDRLPKTAVVNDLVYVPIETPLLAAAKARGNPTVDGLGMLLYQAKPAFAAFFGVEPEVTPELRAFVLAGLATR